MAKQQRSSAKKGQKILQVFLNLKASLGAFRVGVNPSWELVSASCFDQRERKMKARFLTLQSFDWKLSIFAFLSLVDIGNLVWSLGLVQAAFQSIGTLSRKLPESIFSF